MEKDIKKTSELGATGENDQDSRPSKSRIAQRLKESIARAGGNKNVAAKTGIPLSTINNYTTGESEPKLSAAAQISNACNVSLNWLAFGEGAADENAPAADSETGSLTQITLTVYSSIYESGKLVSPATFGSLLSSFYNVYREMGGGKDRAPGDDSRWRRLKDLLAVALKASQE